MVIAVHASSSSAADPEVVVGNPTWTEGQCGTDSGTQLSAGSVPVSEATFNGASPLLTLAAGDGGGLYVGDTAAVREVARGQVSTVVGRTPPSSSPQSTPFESPVGRARTEVDVTVSGLAVSGDEVYFVNRGGPATSPTMQLLSVDLAERSPVIAARSLVLAGGGPGPHGLAVDESGTLYVTDSAGAAGGRLGRLSRLNQTIDWLALPEPVESVAVDAAGDRAYIAGEPDHVQEVDFTATPPRVTPIGPRLSRAATKRVALDRAGRVLFVSDPGTGTIEQIDLTRPDESRPLGGDGGPTATISVKGMGFGRDGAGQRLFVLESVHCAVLSLAPLPPASAPTGSPGSTPQSIPAGDDGTTPLTTPGQRASDTDALSGGPNSGGGQTSLEDTGGRLTADDLVNQLLGGRSDGAFGGSQAVADDQLALLSAPGSRGEGLLSADLSGMAVEQAAASNAPPLPPPPPPVVPSPGPEGMLSSAIGAPPAPIPAAPHQPAGSPPPAAGQVNPTPGWGGASGDAAEGAPRYAIVRNDDGGLGAAAVLTGLVALGGCSLVFALTVAARGPGCRRQPAPARAWVR